MPRSRWTSIGQLAQGRAADLAGLGARQCSGEFDAPRHLEAREHASAVRDQLFGERIAGLPLLDDARYFHLHGTGVFYRQR